MLKSNTIKHPFKISLLFGIPMLIIGVVLMIIGNKPESNLVEGFFTPVVAFEFIQTSEEVAQFFNVSAPNSYRIDFMLGNNIDYFFMFCYSAFLGFTGIGIIKQTGLKILWIAVALSVVIFLADLFENLTMANIISLHFENAVIPDSLFGNLGFFTWLKWGSIAAALLMYCGYFFKQGYVGIAIGFTTLVNLAFAIVAILNRSIFNELMGLTTIVLFVLIFIQNVIFKPEKTSI